MTPAPFALVSLTFRQAPSATRALAIDAVDDATGAALAAHGVAGIVAVHTCARSAWILSAPEPAWAGALVQSRVAACIDGAVLPSVLVGADAAREVLRVACGLDSHVEGEADIGKQVIDAMVRAKAAGRMTPELVALHHAVGRLLSAGRASGFVRAGLGLGALAVRRLRDEGVRPSDAVAVLGAGAIGQRVMAALERSAYRRVTLYNRSPRTGALPLHGFAGADAAIVCTAAPAPWFSGPARVVVDLGVPAQALGQAIGIDALLDGAGVRLDGRERDLAEAWVERERLELEARLQALARKRQVEEVTSLRHRFEAESLDALVDQGMGDAPPSEVKRARAVARAAVRRYAHEVVVRLREPG